MSALFSKQDQLVGKRVVLRALTPEDFDGWSEVRKRGGSWLTQWEPMALSGIPNAADSRLAYLARCSQRDRERESGLGYGFGIFVGSDFAGEINLNNIVRGAYQNAYVGYWVDKARAGQGLMPEALVLVMQFCFEEIGLHRVQVSIIPRNHSSRRVVEKIGLREEGLAQRYLEINGVWEDHIRYAMTVEEWRERGEELVKEFC